MTKQKGLRRLLSLALTFAMLLALLYALPASAETSGDCGDNLKWTLDGEGTLTISGTGAMTDWEHYKLVPWYLSSNDIKTVNIQSGVTGIGDNAFFKCSALTSITIPDSVTSIGFNAFLGTAYYSDSNNWTDGVLYINKHLIEAKEDITGDYVVKEGTVCIADDAFSNCDALTGITIPDGVAGIGGGAFFNCDALTSVTIPNSVTSIGECAFYVCSELASIDVDTDNPNYCSADGNLFNKDKTKLIQYAIGKTDKNYSIPNGVTSIGDDAFAFCKTLTSVTIPDGVTSIGWEAFYECSALKSITIPNGVTSIDRWTFWNCSMLTSVTIPDSVTSIGEYAFDSCRALTDVYYSGTKEQWDSINKGQNNDPLLNANIQYNFTPPEPTPAASGECGDNLTWTLDDAGTLTISGTGDMTDWDWYDDVPWYSSRGGIKTVSIQSGVTSVSGWAFYDCDALTSVTIPDSVISIGERAFYGCDALTSVTIPDSITSIGEGAFNDCSALKSITIGSGVTSIGKSAFEDCSALTSINVDAANKNYCSVDGNLFNKDKTELIQYAIGKADTEYSIPDGVTSIGFQAFYGCDALTSVTIPDSVTSIGDSAFSYCKALTSVAIPDSVTSIGGWAFNECRALTDVYYSGTKEQWESINKGQNNDPLLNANIQYNFTPPKPAPEHLPEPEVTVTKEDDKYIFNVTTKTDNSGKTYITAVKYGENGDICGIRSARVEDAAKSVNISVPKSANDTTVRIFIWNEKMHPLTKVWKYGFQ